MIAGANKNDYHLRNVTPGEDFKPEFADLRQVDGGDACVDCGAELQLHKTIEIGHIFKLGYKYSEVDGAARARIERRGSHADHGILRDRHRAHSERGDRTESRRGRHVPAGVYRSVRRGGHAR